MQTRICLAQFHQLLSGFFVASASYGNLSHSFGLLLKPKFVSKEKVSNVPAQMHQLLMCAFKNSSTGKIEWCSYQFRKLMPGHSVEYALSGLAAFPIPEWPFFGNDNPSLNSFCHLDSYLSAYHQDIEVKTRTDSSIKISNGRETLFVYYDSSREIVCSAHVAKDSCLTLSFYDKSIGACIIDSKQTSSSNLCPINSIERLDPLQYSGNVHCLRLNKSVPHQSFSSLLYLFNNDMALESASQLIDAFVEASDSSSSLLEPDKIVNSLFDIS